jgi:hypothetical protein
VTLNFEFNLRQFTQAFACTARPADRRFRWRDGLEPNPTALLADHGKVPRPT